MIDFNITPKKIFAYRPYWAKRFGLAPFLPTSRQEMDALGWDSCDVILVTGDAYIDHPSFSMALIGRVLEAQGFRVGIIAQPDWHNTNAFKALGKPNLYFGITAGNMDSMVNRYTADRKIRSDDAYTPNGEANKRPDRAAIVYSQRCREAFPDVPIILGGIEASLRRIAHYDYWSDKVRRSILIDSKADILLYGNAERAIIDLTHRLSKNEPIAHIIDLRGTAFVLNKKNKDYFSEFVEVDSSQIDTPHVSRVLPPSNPYSMEPETIPPAQKLDAEGEIVHPIQFGQDKKKRRQQQVIRMPAYEQVENDPVLYAHAARILHYETNPHNARPLIQQHDGREVWLNPPPIPLETEELDWVFERYYARIPHPSYGTAHIPAYEMIKFSVNIMRGCFGGCTFCSITEHEGRIIQSRSEPSILQEIERIRDVTPGFAGHITDIGGPTANMYRLGCKSPEIESACRKLSCVYPKICQNLKTDHNPLVQLYRKVRAIPGIKRVTIGSGVRYDLAVQSEEYIQELATYHVGGYLKIAPEHTESGPLSKMMKPGIETYYRFKTLFEKYSRKAGKEQYLIPYFIAAHPGTSDEDMLNLAIWLKQNGFRPDQVQTFLPSPMALATAMYHSERNPLKKVSRTSEFVWTAKNARTRKLHKAFLRYHDPENWPLLRETLRRMGRADLIGNGKQHLVPRTQPKQLSPALQSAAKKSFPQKRKMGTN